MSFRPQLLFLTTFPFLFVFASSLAGQTLTVRLINGNSGKPMKNFNVTLRWDKELKSSVVFIGSDGIGHVDAVLGATAFAMVPGPRIGKEPGRIAYIDCNKGSSALFSIQEVLDKGVVPENACTSKNLKPTAGEVVFWGLPRHWWQLDLQ